MNFYRDQTLTPNCFCISHAARSFTRCRRKAGGQWVEANDAFVDDWSPDDYQALILTLRDILAQGGIMIGAFADGQLKGFTAVKAGLFGQNREYLDLEYIHVSEDTRGRGIGRALFALAKDWAQAQGAGKLYISAHSAVETQAFYQAMGCMEAMENDAEHVRREPYDCQLECTLQPVNQ